MADEQLSASRFEIYERWLAEQVVEEKQPQSDRRHADYDRGALLRRGVVRARFLLGSRIRTGGGRPWYDLAARWLIGYDYGWRGKIFCFPLSTVSPHT